MRALIALVSVICIAVGDRAVAHGIDLHDAGPQWTNDPWIVVPLAVFGGLFGSGMMRLSRRLKKGAAMWTQWRVIAAVVGWVTLAAALVSPLHWLGEHLFTFHMIEHELVMAVSAPLLVAGRPLGILLWGLPTALRQRAGRLTELRASRALWRWSTDGVNATVMHGIAIWAWHVPALFDAAVENVVLHRLQHLSFFLTAILFWWAMFWRCGRGVAAWHIFVTMTHTGVLGALMTFAPRVLYGAQTQAAANWGLSPLEDQQLAGIIMWIPAGTVYAGCALAMFALWIRRAGEGGSDVRLERP
jgi:putative membrane protein